MTSLERLDCAARRKEPDLIPVAPYLGNHGARLARIPLDHYCQSGQLMAEAQLRTWEIYQQDAVVPQSDNYYIAEGFGITVEHHPNSTPTLKTPVVHELRDIDSLKIPDPWRTGRMPVYLEAIQRLARALPPGVAIRAPGTGPFSLASHLMGIERFLLALVTASKTPGSETERAMRALMELTTGALIAFAKACLDAGAHLVQAGDSLASIDMISPRMYREWAFPYEQKFFQALNACSAKPSAMTLLHICGNMTPVLAEMADTGAQILELDSKVDLKTAKAKVGHRVCLMGNLNPTQLLLQGTPQQVEQASLQAIADAGSSGGFILGSGCEVPVAAPSANVHMMITAARRLARR